jgi:hypothetical protein
MRPTAKIEKLPGFIDGNPFIGLGELLDEMAFHEVAFALELLKPLLTRQKLTRIGNVLLRQFLHLLLNLLKVVGSKRSRPVKIVEEAVLGGWTVTELGLGEQFKDGRRQQVSGGMPVDL